MNEPTAQEKAELEAAKQAAKDSQVAASFQYCEDPIQAANDLIALEPMGACAILDLINPIMGVTLVSILDCRIFDRSDKAREIKRLAKHLNVRGIQAHDRVFG